MKRHGWFAAVLVVASALAAGGCGSSATPQQASLETFIARAGEVPGFSLGKLTVHGKLVEVKLNGTDGLVGASAVEAASSVRAALAYERKVKPKPESPGKAGRTQLTDFAVPGVPGAKGQIVTTTSGGDASAIEWVEGSCVLLAADYAVSGTAPKAPMIAAAQAIYRRTRGLSCR